MVIKHPVVFVLALGVLAGVSRMAPTAQQPVSDGPQYASGGKLMLPADYREWAYLTSGLGMTYGPARPAAGRPANFDNVFVNRESFRQFMATGKWPDKTMFYPTLFEVARRMGTVKPTYDPARKP